MKLSINCGFIKPIIPTTSEPTNTVNSEPKTTDLSNLDPLNNPVLYNTNITANTKPVPNNAIDATPGNAASSTQVKSPYVKPCITAYSILIGAAIFGTNIASITAKNAKIPEPIKIPYNNPAGIACAKNMDEKPVTIVTITNMIVLMFIPDFEAVSTSLANVCFSRFANTGFELRIIVSPLI